MRFKQGDLFTTECYYIGHGVNVDGLMGAGVAKTVRDKYPAVYESYKKRCNPMSNSSNPLKPGMSYGVFQHGKVIVNLATQDRPGAHARYDWVFSSCYDAAVRIATNRHLMVDRVMAIPQIGSGIGGLEWDKVQKVLETVELVVPNFEFEVWEYK